MLSTTVARSLRLSGTKLAAPRAIISRGFGVEDKFRSKEKVEEDRYMRQLELEFLSKKKAAMEEKMHEEEEKIFQETIAPTMAEIQKILDASNDTLSHDALEAIARWKLDM